MFAFPHLLCLTLLLLSAPSAPSAQRIRKTPSGLEYVRTPSSRFLNLPDYPHPPRYTHVSGLRMAYVDAGYATHGTILLLHGEPDWGYLYRRMIPPLVAAGFRVVVPDLVGFGRSDKPVHRAAYSVAAHVGWLAEFVRQLDLRGATLVAQDWGGFLGLTLAAEMPGAFARLVVGNTALPAGGEIHENPQFGEWVQFSQTVRPFVASELLAPAVLMRNLTEGERRAYDAPFPGERYLTGARMFPLLVPTGRDSEGAARFRRAREVLSGWEKPVLLVWGLRDFGLGRRFFEDLRGLVPGAEGQPHALFSEAGHFVQEDVGEYLAAIVAVWIKGTGEDKCAR